MAGTSWESTSTQLYVGKNLSDSHCLVVSLLHFIIKFSIYTPIFSKTWNRSNLLTQKRNNINDMALNLGIITKITVDSYTSQWHNILLIQTKCLGGHGAEQQLLLCTKKRREKLTYESLAWVTSFKLHADIYFSTPKDSTHLKNWALSCSFSFSFS